MSPCHMCILAARNYMYVLYLQQHTALAQLRFNGDWVDRGRHQLEVMLLILSLKKLVIELIGHRHTPMHTDWGARCMNCQVL